MRGWNLQTVMFLNQITDSFTNTLSRYFIQPTKINIFVLIVNWLYLHYTYSLKWCRRGDLSWLARIKRQFRVLLLVLFAQSQKHSSLCSQVAEPPKCGSSPTQLHDKRDVNISQHLFYLSTGGLEPPQLSPHAPQACVSTIPPHRHRCLNINLSLHCQSSVVDVLSHPPSKNLTFSQLFSGVLTASTHYLIAKLWCV